MLRNLIQFKSTVQGVENYFYFDANCPVVIAKEALFECLKWLGQVEDQVKAQEEAKKQAEAEQPKEVLPEQPQEEQVQAVEAPIIETQPTEG